MGQKVNPVSLRLAYIQGWESGWFATKAFFANYLVEDEQIRAFLRSTVSRDILAKIVIERRVNTVNLVIHTSRPGMLIGPGGAKIAELTQALKKKFGAEFYLNVYEIKKPELDAALVAEQIAAQIAARVMYKRVLKQAISSTLRSGALGIRIKISGRLAGAEIARTEVYKEGRVPLHTLRADIHHAHAEAMTIYGKIGISVAIFLGEVYGKRDLASINTPPVSRASRK